MKDSLETLLKKIAELCNSQCDDQQGQEIPQIFAQELHAQGCGVFLRSGKNFILTYEYFLGPCYHNWQQYTQTIPESVQYLSDSTEIFSLFHQQDWQRVLLLPFKEKGGTEGILLAYWKDISPLEDLNLEECGLWQALANQLALIYYWRPRVEKMKQREESLVTMFHLSEDTWEDQRRQTAGKLSCEVVQNLTSIVLQTKLLQDSKDIEYVLGRLGGIRYILSQTIAEVQDLGKSLRPQLLDKLGLHAALEAFVQEYMEKTKIHVELILPEPMQRLEEKIEVLIFRSVEEALHIGAKEAGLNEFIVKLFIKGSNIFLCISFLGRIALEQKQSEPTVLAMKEKVLKYQGKLWFMKHNDQYQSLNILLPL